MWGCDSIKSSSECRIENRGELQHGTWITTCWFCTDDEIVVDMVVSIPRRIRCCGWKTKSRSTRYCGHI